MTTQQMIAENALFVKETEPFTALSFTTNATLKTLAAHSHVPENLYDEADRLNLTVGGPIQYVYTGISGDTSTLFRLDIALPIYQRAAIPFAFSYQPFPSFRCLSYTHFGSWDDFPEIYDALFAQFRRAGYQNDGRIREVYVVVDEENRENCVTEIQIGIV
jgi:effector-binding domain-containing protein